MINYALIAVTRHERDADFLIPVEQCNSDSIECCSEVFVSGGYEFREKSKTIDLARRFQRDSLQLPKYGRYYHSHVVYRGALYLLGGFSMKGPTNEVQVVHHPRQQGWQNTFRMERSRGFFQAAVFQGKPKFSIKILGKNVKFI